MFNCVSLTEGSRGTDVHLRIMKCFGQSIYSSPVEQQADLIVWLMKGAAICDELAQGLQTCKITRILRISHCNGNIGQFIIYVGSGHIYI